MLSRTLIVCLINILLLALPARVLADIRAVFYYPWFPETENWASKYEPSLGYYKSDNLTVIATHIRMIESAGFDVAIASWWGPMTLTDKRIARILEMTLALQSKLKWALYHEAESLGDPSRSAIGSDLTYIAERYGSNRAFLRVDDRPVIFVYAAANDACDMAKRWHRAHDGFHVVLKVFKDYPNCAKQPDGWHQYGPATAIDSQGRHSVTVSPGFFKFNEDMPRLPRSAIRFRDNVRSMLKSQAEWKLIISFNEWGEGTSIEPAVEWSSRTGQGLYLDIVREEFRRRPPRLISIRQRANLIH
jgi:hypothetical protein